MSILLTSKELQEITGKVKPSAQARYLRALGFTFKLRPDGVPLVARSHFEALMGCQERQTQAQDFQPDFSTLS